MTHRDKLCQIHNWQRQAQESFTLFSECKSTGLKAKSPSLYRAFHSTVIDLGVSSHDHTGNFPCYYIYSQSMAVTVRGKMFSSMSTTQLYDRVIFSASVWRIPRCSISTRFIFHERWCTILLYWKVLVWFGSRYEKYIIFYLITQAV